jgi:serpin B
MISRSTLLPTVALAVLIAACGRPEFGSTTSGGDVIQADYEREEASNNGAPDVNDPRDRATANGDEGPVLDPAEPNGGGGQLSASQLPFTIYRAEAQHPRDVAIVPHGVIRSLVVSYAAVGGDTATTIESVLGGELGGDLFGGFNSVDQNLGNSIGDLGMLPAVWVDAGVAVDESFTEALARYLGLQVRLIDLSAADDARSEINNWYAQQTGGAISEVLAPRTVGADDRFLVTDASWFSTTWGFGGFDPDRTTFETFAGSESNVELPMMRADETLLYFGEPELQAVVLPLDGGLSLVAVLADEPENFDDVVDESFVSRLIDEAIPTPIALSFPRLEVSDLTTLSGVADELGVQELFAADTEFLGFADGTMLSDAHHRVRVSFDENGIEIDSDGAVEPPNVDPGMSPSPSSAVPLRFDRPFFFGVRDAATGTFILLGRVSQPE